jgi:hypothetical protein
MSNPPAAKLTRAICCEQCGKDSLAVAKNQFDGWTKTVQWQCAFCGAVIPAATMARLAAAESPPDVTPQERHAKAAAAFLGEEITPPPRLFADETDGRFCKYCRHFLFHPFQCRCQLWKRPADPMRDCPQFEKKS